MKKLMIALGCYFTISFIVTAVVIGALLGGAPIPETPMFRVFLFSVQVTGAILLYRSIAQ